MEYDQSELMNDTVELRVSESIPPSAVISLLDDISYHSRPNTYTDEFRNPIQEDALYKGYGIGHTEDGGLFVRVYFDRNKSLARQYRQLGRDLFRHADEVGIPCIYAEAKCQRTSEFVPTCIGMGMCECEDVGYMNNLSNRRLYFKGQRTSDQYAYDQWAKCMVLILA